MNAEFNLSMLKCIYAMLKNFTGNAIKAECILRYTYYAFSPATCDVEHAFLNYYADRMLMSDHLDFGKIRSAFRDFKEDCNKNAIDGNIYLPEMFDSDDVYAERIFILFVRMSRTAAETIDSLKGWTANMITHTVLDCMCDYYSDGWKSGKTVEEYFLSCLLSKA